MLILHSLVTELCGATDFNNKNELTGLYTQNSLKKKLVLSNITYDMMRDKETEFLNIIS